MKDGPYWNDGAGWRPLGIPGEFNATFEGNRHTIRHLFIDRSASSQVGLFGRTESSASIRGVGVVDVDVRGSAQVGGLVGNNHGSVVGSYVTGRVSGGGHAVGGLVGYNLNRRIVGSYATGRVSGTIQVGGLVGVSYSEVSTSYAAVSVSGRSDVGGLVGTIYNSITASYATGGVSSRETAGGLAGRLNNSISSITASYATGRVTGGSTAGGLLGRKADQAAVTESYWDTQTSGQATGSHGRGRTTAEIQAPTGSTGIYAGWSTGSWDFGMADEYPVLVVDSDGDQDATWEEFGHQLREGPALTAEARAGRAVLSWTAVDTSHWTPAPAVAYTVYRTTGSSVDAVAENLAARAHTDLDVTRGTTYAYQVAAVVNGGEAARSAVVTLMIPRNRSPVQAGSLPPLSLRVVDGAATVEVAGAFGDPDGDMLAYAASSSNGSVAQATATGSAVTVVPLSGGTATITVTATDTGGLNATQTFLVTVANRAPVPVGSLAALSLRLPDGAQSVRLSGAFRDPDGDPLGYRASSSNEAVATVSVSGSALEVTPLSAGTATVTVTATDGGGLSATQALPVTVANRSPEAVGTLPAVTRRAVDGALTVQASGAFRDADGDVLTFGASSSDTSVVTVSVSGSLVEGDAAVCRDGDGDGDGDRRGRVEHERDADVRGDGAGERGARGGGYAGGQGAAGGGRGADRGGVRRVPGPGPGHVDVCVVVVERGGVDGVGVRLDGDVDAGVAGNGDGDGDGNRCRRLEHVGDAAVLGDGGGEPVAGGGGHAAASVVAGGGRRSAGGRIERVPRSGRRCADPWGVVVIDVGGDGIGVGLDGDGEGAVGRHGGDHGNGPGCRRLEHDGRDRRSRRWWRTVRRWRWSVCRG